MENARTIARSSLVFVTATGTGAGKTVLTGLLLAHLRRRGIHALAVKPFMTGGWGDAQLLAEVQDGELSLGEITPFFFPEPLAPAVAARRHRRPIALETAVSKILALKSRCDVLLVEGIGGLRVPLGPGFTVAELIAALHPQVLVAAPNQLGVLNHAILTARDLYSIGAQRFTLVVMNQGRADLAAGSNVRTLRQWLRPNPVHELPWLGKNAGTARGLIACEKKIKNVVARVWRSGRLMNVATR